MKRLLLLVLALSIGLIPALALAQNTATLEVPQVILDRYEDDGQTTLVVEFRNLDGTLDPSQLQVTANGQQVADLVDGDFRHEYLRSAGVW